MAWPPTTHQDVQDAVTLLRAATTVLPAPSGDTTGATDTAALQAAINASTANTTLAFQSGTYWLNAPLVLKPQRAYLGTGYGYGVAGTTLKQANSVNMTNTAGLTGIVVGNAWNTNSSLCDEPILISNLCIDGNSANNPTSTACGLILWHYHSRVEHIQIQNVPKHGVHLTDTTANGTTVGTNSASENKLLFLRIDTCGGNGVNQVSANGNSNLDGVLTDSYITNISGDGIKFQRAAGWVIRRQHLYIINGNGINLDACFATLVEGNYIEDFGTGNVTGTYYDGIAVNQLGGWGTTVVNNLVSCNEPSTNAVGAYQYMHITAKTGQTDANVIVAENHLYGPAAFGTKGLGLVLDYSSGGILYVRRRGNRIGNVNSRTYIAGTSVKVLEEDGNGIEHAVYGASTTAAAGSNAGTSPPAPVLAAQSGDFSGQVTFGTGTTPAAGIQVSVTFERAFAVAPAVTVTPGNSGTASLTLYAQSTTTGFTIRTVNAPTASQANTVYAVSYRVTG